MCSELVLIVHETLSIMTPLLTRHFSFFALTWECLSSPPYGLFFFPVDTRKRNCLEVKKGILPFVKNLDLGQDKMRSRVSIKGGAMLLPRCKFAEKNLTYHCPHRDCGSHDLAHIRGTLCVQRDSPCTSQGSLENNMRNAPPERRPRILSS